MGCVVPTALRLVGGIPSPKLKLGATISGMSSDIFLRKHNFNHNTTAQHHHNTILQSFLTNLLAFLALSAILLYGIYRYSTTVVENEDANHYLAASIDRHARLATLDKPHIVFMGNSNLAFGLDSEYLEREWGRPVVNLGLHGALGLNFIVEETLSVIEKGDVVVVCIPYYLNEAGSGKMLYTMNRVNPESKAWTKGVTAYNRFGFAVDDAVKLTQKARKQGFRKITIKKKASVYRRNAFNKYGDVIAHTRMPVPKKRKAWSPNWDVEGFDTQINTLTDFYEKAQAKGVEVYMVYPCFMHSMYQQTTKELNILQDYYAELPFEVLGKPEDFAYADSLFFDTVYHLNKQGREKWSRELVDLLGRKVKRIR